MVARAKAFFRLIYALMMVSLTVAVYALAFCALAYGTILILGSTVGSYGLFGGILIAVPFVIALWMAGLFFGAWLRTAK